MLNPQQKREVAEWERHKGEACNSVGYECDCVVCDKRPAKWSMHHYYGERPAFALSHIAICGEMPCVTEAIKVGYVGCGCGG